MTSSRRVVLYVKYSHTPCSFQVMRDEERKRKRKDEQIESFTFGFLNFEKG